jgi:hypothetical protein
VIHPVIFTICASTTTTHLRNLNHRAGVSCPADTDYVVYFDIALTTPNPKDLFFQFADQFLIQDQQAQKLNGTCYAFSLQAEARSEDDRRMVLSKAVRFILEADGSGGMTMKVDAKMKREA